MGKIFLILLILINISLPSQTGEEPKVNFLINGNLRFRGFLLGRDALLNRQTRTEPTLDIPAYYKFREQQTRKNFEDEVDRRTRGLPSQISHQKEKLNYYDTRMILNMEFQTSPNFTAVVGFVIGDIPFGGRALQPRGPNINDPFLTGAGSGGELRNASGTNVLTSALYLQYRRLDWNFNTKVGLQFFSSVQGRVMFTIGAGFSAVKDFPEDKLSMELGWIRARERSLVDLDSNGFNDRNYQSSNIYYGKLRYYQIKNLKSEIYNYYSKDNDPSDELRETGDLLWTGFFNEYNFQKFSMILHGVYNFGNVKVARSLVDNRERVEYQQFKNFKISGYLVDFQLNYNFDQNTNFSFIAIGTSGRPGFDADGLPASYKGNGYRTLAPGYAISNIAVDFIGGYALFNARNMSGLVEYGISTTSTIKEIYQFTFGYYRLYASQAPRLSVNRDYNSIYQQESSNFLGDEFNFNIKWSYFKEFQIHFRSGIFRGSKALKAINDYVYGIYLREAFISAEYKF